MKLSFHVKNFLTLLEIGILIYIYICLGLRIEIPCTFYLFPIDYFSLDVEGSELDILKTIPFDKVDIKVSMGCKYFGLPNKRTA